MFLKQRFAVWLVLSVLVHGVMAQDYEKVKPKELPPAPPQTELPVPAPKGPGEAADRVLIPALKDVLVARKITEGKAAETLPTDAELQELAKPYIGKPLTKRSLDNLIQQIIRFYRSKNLPVVNVLVPEQDLSEGVLSLAIIEGELGEVRAEGNRWFRSGALTSQVRLWPGDVILQNRLLDDVNWINANPFRNVAPVFTPGKKPGQTDIVLKTQDRFPVRFYGGIDDSGSDATDDARVIMGFNWGDALFLDHRANYQVTASPDFDKLLAHSGSYTIPLPWRHNLTFLGSYSESHADLVNPLFDLRGKTWQTSLRYGIPLETFGDYTHETLAGFDFKSSNNNLGFGGTQVFSQTTEIAQWVLGYNGALKDEWGRTAVGIDGTFSPGDLTAHNIAVDFQATRANSRTDYTVGHFNLERETKLPADFTWMIKGTYQLADANLLASEQLGLGGRNTVRGYDESEVTGDEGYLVSTEIRTPPIELVSRMGWTKMKDQVQFLAFVDHGAAGNNILLPGEKSRVQLTGVGTGLRYSFASYLSVSFDYGWQLDRTGFNQRHDQRGHLAVTFSY